MAGFYQVSEILNLALPRRNPATDSSGEVSVFGAIFRNPKCRNISPRRIALWFRATSLSSVDGSYIFGACHQRAGITSLSEGTQLFAFRVALAEGRDVLLTELRSPQLKRSSTCIKDGEVLPLPARSSKVLQTAVAMNFIGDG